MREDEKLEWVEYDTWTPETKVWHGPMDIGNESLKPKSGWMSWKAPDRPPQARRQPKKRGIFDN